MSPPKPDRRTHRTVRTLQQALLDLTRRQGYETITVEALCEQADVGRSTFYEHFRSKDDLKRSGLRRLEAELAARPLPADLAFTFSLPVLRHAQAHRPHIQALGHGRGREVAFKAMAALVHRQVAREIEAARGGPADDGELATRFFAGAFMAVLQAWLDAGAHTPPEQVDEMFRRLAGGG